MKIIAIGCSVPTGRHMRRDWEVGDGSRLRLLTNYTGGAVGAFAGSYSPNGRWIVFRVENPERERFRLVKMRPDGTHRKLIKRLPFPPGFIDWAPRP